MKIKFPPPIKKLLGLAALSFCILLSAFCVSAQTPPNSIINNQEVPRWWQFTNNWLGAAVGTNSVTTPTNAATTPGGLILYTNGAACIPIIKGRGMSLSTWVSTGAGLGSNLTLYFATTPIGNSNAPFFSKFTGSNATIVPFGGGAGFSNLCNVIPGGQTTGGGNGVFAWQIPATANTTNLVTTNIPAAMLDNAAYLVWYGYTNFCTNTLTFGVPIGEVIP